MALLITCNKLKILRRVISSSNGSGWGCPSFQTIRCKHGSGRGNKTRGRTSDGVSFQERPEKGLPASSDNTFDSQYFGNVLDKVHASSSEGRTSSEVPVSRPSEGLANEFDSQYFQELRNSDEGVSDKQSVAQSHASSKQPGRTIKGHYMFNDINLDNFDNIDSSFVYEHSTSTDQSKVHGEGGMNTIDEQYFGKIQTANKQKSTDGHVAHKSKLSYQFIDTNKSEEELYTQFLTESRREQTLSQDQRNLEETADKPFESFVKPAAYQHISSDKYGDHREVHLITSPTIDPSVLDNLPPDLRGKLIAQRQWQEKDKELRVGHHHLSDLEDSVVSALRAVKKKPKKSSKPRRSSEQITYGTEDKDVPVSNVACSGCGAYLHCQDRSNPGFIPSEKFKEMDVSSPLSNAVCQRCWYIIHHHTAVNIAIPDDHYSDIIKIVRKNRRALVIMMVDLLDFPCGLIKNLKDLLGPERPVVIVGNKFDLIPKDEPKHEHRIKQHLLTVCIEAGLCTEDKVKYVGLISAKTGYKVEELISKIHSVKPPKGDVYLLGTANVGKSTLFNRLLESDLCKAKASQLMGRATISRWPGTTLNLLRFPLLHPTKQRLAERAQRLKEEAESEKKLQKRELQGRTGNKPDIEEGPRLDAYFEGKVGQTFKTEKLEPALPEHSDPFSVKVAVPSINRDKTRKPRRQDDGRSSTTFDPREFEMGEWFYDTPGVLYKDQVLSLLTDEELKLVVPKKGILPRSLILKPGQTFFLGGLGRIDYVKGERAIFLTVFSSQALPIKVFPTGEADGVYREKGGTLNLLVPQGGKERMQSFPELVPTDMTLQGVGQHMSVADVLFSSVGWAAVTAKQNMDVHLRAFTPGGLGCTLRSPSLVPYGFALRGPRRSKSSPYYNINKNKLLMFMS